MSKGSLFDNTPYDKASRYASKMDGDGFFTWLVGKRIPRLRMLGWLDCRTITLPGHPDKTCDTIALLQDLHANTFFAVPIEFFAKPFEKTFGQVLEYTARLWQEEHVIAGASKVRVQVIAAAVFLTGRGKLSLEMWLPETTFGLSVVAIERNLAQEDALTTLAAIETGACSNALLPFIPLMKRGTEPDTIKMWKRLALLEPDARRRSDFGALAQVFAELIRGGQIWQRELEGWDVRQSPKVLEWQEEARNEGLRKGLTVGRTEGLNEGLTKGRTEGLTKGRTEGLNEGLTKGRTEGRREGLAEGKIHAVLRTVERRFGADIPVTISRRVRATKDPAILDAWLDAALTATSLKDFQAALKTR